MESSVQTLGQLVIFLIDLVACLFAILIFEAIKNAINKNVSIFSTYKNTKLYCLSFVYEIARNLKLEGKSDIEIQNELQRRYKAKALPFMISLQPSKTMLEAIDFVGIVINDTHLLFTYVATPAFGKNTYKILLTKVNLKEEERDAEFAMKSILIDDSEDNVKRCQKWLQCMCTRPFMEEFSDCGEKDKGGRNEALLFTFLKPAEGEDESPDTFVFKKKTSERAFVDCLLKLKKCHPSVEVVKMTAFNRQYNIVSGGGEEARRKERQKYLEHIKLICQDFGK